VSFFTDFFPQSGQSGPNNAAGGNIFAGIRPPKFASFGNSENFSKAGNWMTENFVIPNHLGYILGINFGYKVTVATWNNTLVWYVTDGSLGANSVISALIYNQVLDKWYISSTGAFVGVYEVNILTGARTLVTPTVPAFLAQAFPNYACLSYCNAEGLYEWRDGNTIRKYSQNFVEVQNRAFVAANNVNDANWYYTEDCKIRAQSITSWKGQGTSNTTTVTPVSPRLLIERYGSRRLVDLTAAMVFSARNDDLSASNMTPMVPTMSTGAFLGNAVRLGVYARDVSVIADPYLLDRVDYDRWLSDVADALGMPDAPAFYGDWTNV